MYLVYTGYGSQTLNVVKELIKEHEVTCIAQVSDTVVWGAHQYVETENGSIHVVPLTHPPVTLINDSYIPRYKFDVIIGFMDAFGLEYLNHVNCPVVGWIPIDGPFTPKWKHHVRDFYNVIAYSNYGYNQLRPWFSPSKTGYIPHSVAPAFLKDYDKEKKRVELSDEHGIPEDSFLILNVGANIGPRKELPLMMWTFKRLIDDGYDAHLFLHTNAFSQHPRGYDLIEWRRNLKLEDRIHFPYYNPILNPASNEALAELHTAADLYSQNSVAEGLGLPIIESMGTGTAVTVPDNSAQVEHLGGDLHDDWVPVNQRMGVGIRVRSGRNGWLVESVAEEVYVQIPVYVPQLPQYPVPNQRSLLDTWKYVIDHPEQVKEKGRNAREYVKEHHSPARTNILWRTYLDKLQEELNLWKELAPVFK